MKPLIKALAALLLMIALLFALTSCKDATDAAEDCADASADCTITVTTNDDDPTTDTPPPAPPPEPEDEGPTVIVEIDTTPEAAPAQPTPEIEIVIQITEPDTPLTVFEPLFVLQIDNTVYLDDTVTRHFLMQGTIDKAAPGLWLIDDKLLSLDATPDAITLNHTPTQAHATPDALYTCIEIDPTTAQAAGGQAEYYTEFYIDQVSTGHWVTNQHRCVDIVSAGGYVFAISETGALIQIDGPATDPLYILDGEFVTHNLDSVNNRIDFNDTTESYAMNYLTAANQWQRHGDSYYSETGYIWSPVSGLQESATALQDFNTDPRPIELPFPHTPTLISAGTRSGLIYWIEGNTGWLIEYDPAQDVITTPHRLYSGDGTRATGTQHRDTLSPVVIAQYIYFSLGGILKRLDLDTGFFDEVYSGEATIFLID